MMLGMLTKTPIVLRRFVRLVRTHQRLSTDGGSHSVQNRQWVSKGRALLLGTQPKSWGERTERLRTILVAEENIETYSDSVRGDFSEEFSLRHWEALQHVQSVPVSHFHRLE